MKEFTTDKIRNVCLAGQRGCGKTTLADAIAFITGANNRMGRVDEGSSLLDYTDAEISRKTSVTAKLLAVPHKRIKLNLCDAPGHPDFIGELLSSARVCDTIGMVINATAGVEVGTNLHWRQTDRPKTARFFFVNKMENDNVVWQNNLSVLQETFGTAAAPVAIPIGESSGFKGVVDVLTMKAYTFDADGNESQTEIPADMKETVEGHREKLIELAAEGDDALLEKYFEEGTLGEEDFIAGLKKSIREGKVYPILCGSAAKNVGIRVLLDFIEKYAPSPADYSPAEAHKTGTEERVELPTDAGGKAVAYIYHTMSESHLGELSLIRVYSGTLKTGMDLTNQQTQNAERVTQIYSMQGKKRIDLSSVPAGDIGALVKLKDSHTGNTLAESGVDVTIPTAEYPNPVMDVAIKAKSKGDEEKIANGLSKLREEDPTFRLESDPSLGQQVLYGQGPTHIDVLTEKLRERFGVEVELTKPKIPYRETIKGKTERQYRHKKQTGGRGQFGDVYLRLEPNERGAGFEFLNEIKGGVVPSKFIPAVEKGVVESMQHGGLSGSPVVDVKVALYFGSYHDVDSSDMAFKIAGLMAFKEAFMDAKPVILEPIMNVQVIVPDEFTGDVMGDLSSRRGKIGGMEPDGPNQIIRAQVPQAELYQYAVDLRSMTQGQGVYSLEFSHYEEVPYDAAQKIIEEARRQKEEEA